MFTVTTMTILKQLAFEIILILLFVKLVWCLIPRFIRRLITGTLKFMTFAVREVLAPVMDKVYKRMKYREVYSAELSKAAEKEAKANVKAKTTTKKTASTSKKTKNGNVIPFPNKAEG